MCMAQVTFLSVPRCLGRACALVYAPVPKRLRGEASAGVSVTAIPGIKYPIPSELGSQTTTGVVSTAVGDHAGIRRVVTFFFSSLIRHCLLPNSLLRDKGRWYPPASTQSVPCATLILVRARPYWRSAFPNLSFKRGNDSVTFGYGHTWYKVPDPIRTRKSNYHGRRQYCGGGPRGNTTCRNLFFSPILFLPLTLPPAIFLILTRLFQYLWAQGQPKQHLLLLGKRE